MAVKPVPQEPKPDLGKCLICGDPIIANDGVDNHCRQGHVVAVDATKENPISSTEAKLLALEQKEAALAAKIDALKTPTE